MNQPVRVFRSAVIEAPVDAIWRLLRDFNAHEDWHPAIAASRIEAGEPGDSVGAVRAFRLTDGSTLREQLIALSDRERELTYCLLEAPLPLMDYVATLRLRPITDGDRTFATWESRFRPPPAEAQRLSRLVGEDIYEAGFAALKARFEPAATPTSVISLARGGRSAENAERTTDFGRGEDTQATLPKSVLLRPPDFDPPSRGRLPAAADAIETRAIVVPRYGGAEVMEERSVSVPPPGPGEVRLRHTAIGVNFIDIYCRTGFFRLLTPPDVPGMEAAGVVADVGEGVEHVRPGDRVVYACEPVGAYAGVRTMPAALLVRITDDIDDETAAAIFLKGLSAEFLLHRVHRVTPDETIIVHAAAGGVGLLLCQWASAIGAHVIGTVSSPQKAEAARAAGAHHVVIHTHEDFVEVAGRLTQGRGVDVVYDGIGETTFARSLEALAPRGHLISFGQASGPVGSYDIGAFASKSVTVSRPNFGHYTSDPVELAGMAARVFNAVRQGILKPTWRRLPLSAAADAHRLLEDRANIGALILIP